MDRPSGTTNQMRRVAVSITCLMVMCQTHPILTCFRGCCGTTGYTSLPLTPRMTMSMRRMMRPIWLYSLPKTDQHDPGSLYYTVLLPQLPLQWRTHMVN